MMSDTPVVVEGLLLIEPVWNRNILILVMILDLAETFNRTSMESKPILGLVIASDLRLLIEPVWNRNRFCREIRNWIFPAFNRTSMESKLEKSQGVSGCADALLIEPVWNRNVFEDALAVDICDFYRTSMESKLIGRSLKRAFYRPFNRTSMESKLVAVIGLSAFSTAFNRTSMESKLYLVYETLTGAVSLLIEPVWNRNENTNWKFVVR